MGGAVRFAFLALALLGCKVDPRAALLRKLNGDGQDCVKATRDPNTGMILIWQCLACVADWKAACMDAGFDNDCGPDSSEPSKSCH